MPVNIGIAFFAGGALGWVVVLLLRPPQQLRGPVIASSSAGMFSAAGLSSYLFKVDEQLIHLEVEKLTNLRLCLCLVCKLKPTSATCS